MVKIKVKNEKKDDMDFPCLMISRRSGGVYYVLGRANAGHATKAINLNGKGCEIGEAYTTIKISDLEYFYGTITLSNED